MTDQERRFSGLAGSDYERIIEAVPYFHEIQEELGKIVKEAFRDSDEGWIRIDEMGCGTGITTRVILEADPRIQVTAVDNERMMVVNARSNLRVYPLHRWEVIQADALEYMPAICSDGFASANTLHNFNKEYRRKYLSHVQRCLAPGALFVNADKYAYDDPEQFKETLSWQLKQYVEVFSRMDRFDLLREWSEHEMYDKQSHVIMRQGEAIKDMEDAGFTDIQVPYRNQMHAILTARKK